MSRDMNEKEVTPHGVCMAPEIMLDLTADDRQDTRLNDPTVHTYTRSLHQPRKRLRLQG